MMAMAHPKLALRPFLPADAAHLAEIFRASVEELTAEDYTEAQRQAWASTADDEDAFAARLGERLTLIATLEGSVVGFIALQGADEIDMLYVHPAVARQGIGAMLYDAVEKLAASRGAARLTVEASDSASGFFQQRGFVAQQRNTVSLGSEWLANTTMEKKLVSKGSTP
jgi:putative acetyltransferase